MVSLTEVSSIEKAVRESPKANALRSFLAGEVIIVPTDELNEREKVYFSILQALARNQKNHFAEQFAEISNRVVTEEQPIVYDNFLLFALVVGVLKFGGSKDWLQQVLKLRKTQNEPENSITAAFNNLLNHNILTTDGIPSVVMAGLIKTSHEDLDVRLLKSVVEANTKVSAYIGRDLFLATVVLYTGAYVLSVSIDASSLRLRNFESVFLARVKVLQNVIYVLLLVVLTLLWFNAIKKFPQIKPIVNDFGMLLQLIGVGVLAFGLNQIKHLFGELLKWFFGYKK